MQRAMGQKNRRFGMLGAFHLGTLGASKGGSCMPLPDGREEDKPVTEF